MVGNLQSGLFTAVTGLNSNGAQISSISNNIANLNTVGYKASNVSFSSLVSGSSPGGVLASERQEVEEQGLIQSTGVGTDLAISGQGFFVVKDISNVISYTRAGSFRVNNDGDLVNPSGFKLQGWPLDNNGRLPGAAGNTNTTSSQLLESLVDVNVAGVAAEASATTQIDWGINLDASQAALTGAGDTVFFPAASPNNAIGSATIITPTPGGAGTDLRENDVLTVTQAGTTATNFTFGGFEDSNDIAGTILGATTATGVFTGATAGDGLSIQAGSGTVHTFTFQNPPVAATDFNTLQTLADAINTVAELNARVATLQNGETRLYISADDATQSLAFANTGGGGTNFIAAGNLNLSNVAAAANRFNTMDGLATLVNATSGLNATITSPATDARLAINLDDPLVTIGFTDTTGGGGTELLDEFNLSTTTIAAVYEPTVLDKNLASGVINAAFSRDIPIFDSLGVRHDVRLSFAKAANNTWLVEMFTLNPSEITTTNQNGIIAFGTVTFDGDGQLTNVSTGLNGAQTINWTNGASPSSITTNLGTIGTTDGLSQFSGPFTVAFGDQNGVPSGQLDSFEITREGIVTASFTSGESRDLFKIPLTSFPNPNGLNVNSGNVFSQSDASGEFTLNEVGAAAVGEVVSGALEGANVELADQLTEIIIAQRAYQAATQVITTTDELLEELTRI